MLTQPSLFNAPDAGRTALPESTYIQPTLNHGLRIWWAYYWPTNIAAIVLTFCGIFSLRALYASVFISAQTLRISALVLPYLVTALIGILVFRYILGKRFRNFRVALFPAKLNAASQALPPIWRRTIRVWWTFTWRTIIYAIILSFLMNVSLGVFLGMLRESSRLLAVLIPLVQGLIIGGAVGLFVIYSNILDEEFGDFRVVLLPREVAPQPSIAPAIPGPAIPG